MKLALNGQWNDISGLFYAYPENFVGKEIPQWAASLPDPREVRGLFKGDYCYSLWYNEHGYYYACTKTNTDSRNGCVMLAICAEANAPLDGKLLAEKMRSLLDYCLSKSGVGAIEYVDISFKAKEIETLLTNRALPKDVSMQEDGILAYRLYKNEDEMGLILENPNQPSYAGYKRVLAIDESAFGGDAVHSQSVAALTDSIRKTFDIRTDTNDALASVESVIEGESFSITYSKVGYTDETVEAVAGRPSPYYTLNGNVINIKSAAVAGINFKRELILQVLDSETSRPVREWSYRINGGKWNVVKPDENNMGCRILLEPYKTMKMVVSAEGYETKDVDISPSDYGLKTVQLKSTDDSVHVKLQMGKKVYADSVRMKSNNDLFDPLKRIEGKHALQVKRPFFSRRNLVPILVLFAVAALAGLFTGRGIWRTKGGTPVNDTTQVAKSNATIDSLNAKIDEYEKAMGEGKENVLKMYDLYGEALSLIKEKMVDFSDKVKNILAQDDFKDLLAPTGERKVTVDQLERLIQQLREVKQKENRKELENNGGGGVDDKKPTNSDDVLLYLNSNDVWKLNYLKENGFAFLEDAIRNGKWDNMKQYNKNALGNKKITNGSWNSLIEKAERYETAIKDVDTRKMTDFTNALKGAIKNNQINLNDVNIKDIEDYLK